MPRVTAGPVRFVLAGAVTLAAASASAAAPLQSCRLEQAVYQFPSDDEYEIEFSRDFLADKKLGKSGVLRYRASTGLVEYDVYTGWAPRGLFRPYFFITETPKPTDVIEDRAISSVILPFGPDFRPPRSTKTAPPYLVIPKLARDFHYWRDKQGKYEGRMEPPVAWKLVSCRDGRSP